MVLLVGCGVLAASGVAQAQPMRPGQWEITTRTEMTGMPAPIPDQTVSVCVRGQTEDRPPIGSDGTCTFSNYRKSGNSATWQMACSAMGNMTGEGRIDYAGDRYTGESVMKMEIMPGQTMQMRSGYSGRRVGDC